MTGKYTSVSSVTNLHMESAKRIIVSFYVVHSLEFWRLISNIAEKIGGRVYMLSRGD